MADTVTTERAKRSLPRKITSILLQLVFVGVLVWGIDLWQTRDTVHDRPPPIITKLVSHQLFSTEMLKGQPAVIHFWATWCPICGFEQQTIDALADDHPLLSVAMQSGSNRQIVQYLAENGVNYRVVNDDMGLISEKYGVKTVPTTFITDSDGNIRFVTQGYSSELGLRFKLWLASF